MRYIYHWPGSNFGYDIYVVEELVLAIGIKQYSAKKISVSNLGQQYCMNMGVACSAPWIYQSFS